MKSYDPATVRRGAVSEQIRVDDSFVILDPSPGCGSCWGCARVCPARALQVTGGHTRVIRERCVKCGGCVSACGEPGMRVRDDVGRVKELLSSDRRVIVVLATESVAAMHPLSPSQLEAACRDLGFFSVESTFLGEEAVARAYEEVCSEEDAPLTLRSTCPVVVDWVRKYRPSLVTALAPIAPPYIVQSRLVRATYGDDVAVVYVSPCFARKDEVNTPDLRGVVDVAIGFDELKVLLDEQRIGGGARAEDREREREPFRLAPVKQISLTDGFPRTLLARRSGSHGGMVTVRGIKALDRLLVAIESGVARPGVVDMLYCESCIDGPAMGVALTSYARRALGSGAPASLVSESVSSRQILVHVPRVEMSRSFAPAPVREPAFSEEHIDAALVEGGFRSRDEVIDCGACGYATCVEHAVAVLRETSSWEMCVPMQVRRLEQRVAELTESATVDALTGLLNRRVFSERLAQEFARFRRYGLPLSLLMIDLDGFKEINDTFGHTTGDAVLRALARLMKDLLRETDIATRYGGDEFALILPGVDRMAAFAVAEKLRAAMTRLEIPVAAPPAGRTMSATISVGLASADSAMTTYEELFEQADGALYKAKRHGRDRVRLAPDGGSDIDAQS